MTKFFTLAMLCAVLLIGCGEQADDTANVANDNSANTATASPQQPAASQQPAGYMEGYMKGMDIMPLKIGHSWEYQMYMYDSLSDNLRKVNIVTYTVTADSTIGDETWYRIDGMGPNGMWGVNRDDGFWIIGPTGEPMLLAKFPGQTGDEFTRIKGRITIINRIESAGVQVVVPAGTYQCYKYAQEFGSKDRVTYSYYAPGAGLIKMEIMNEAGSKPVMSTELINIKMN